MQSAEVLHLAQQVTGVAEAERAIDGEVMLLHQVVHNARFALEANFLGESEHQAAKFFRAGVFDFDLVGDAAEEGIVSQRTRFEVGRKNDQLIKRYLDAAAAFQLQEVVPLFQGNNPTVQQLVDWHGLSAEVVDQQGSTAGEEPHQRPCLESL